MPTGTPKHMWMITYLKTAKIKGFSCGLALTGINSHIYFKYFVSERRFFAETLALNDLNAIINKVVNAIKNKSNLPSILLSL